MTVTHQNTLKFRSLITNLLYTPRLQCHLAHFFFIYICFQRACMRAGDFITAVSYNDVKWGCHNEVISLIRAAGDNLTLHLVTPLDCNYLQPPVPSSPQVVTCMQSGTLNKGDTRVHRKSWTGGSWKLRKRRSKSREGKADRNIVANGKH